jgi:RimJ/RimL family protein N-acetyltransferase
LENRLTTLNLFLDSPGRHDLPAFKDFEIRNASHLAKWETTSHLESKKDYGSCFDCWKKECDEEKSVRFFLKPKANPELIIGMCNFTQIFRGGFQACYLGYNIDHAYQGKGLMFEAAECGIRYMFEEQQIHRIMANYMPINIRSAKLLSRLGFMVEGFAKDYLLINGRWEDHVLNALSLEKWKADHSFDKIMMKSLSSLHFRVATMEDIEPIVELLFDDELGRKREKISDPISDSYVEAFTRIQSNPNNELIVAELDHGIIGVMQITYLQHLTFQGGLVAHIESVRIQKEFQNRGYGSQMFQWAIDRAKDYGCHRMQLMTDKKRRDAKKFYEQMGFSASHEGMKLFI